MEFTEKKVLVFGTGISGVAAANLLENAGAEVVLFDGNEKLDKAHVLENFTEGKTTGIICWSITGRSRKGTGSGSIKSGCSCGSSACSCG